MGLSERGRELGSARAAQEVMWAGSRSRREDTDAKMTGARRERGKRKAPLAVVGKGGPLMWSESELLLKAEPKNAVGHAQRLPLCLHTEFG